MCTINEEEIKALGTGLQEATSLSLVGSLVRATPYVALGGRQEFVELLEALQILWRR